MDPRTFPTKGNLILAKNSLALANQGYELMDKKRNILIRELMELIDQAKDIQEQIDSTFTHAYKCLQHANIEHGISLVSQLAYTVPIEDSIKIKAEALWERKFHLWITLRMRISRLTLSVQLMSQSTVHAKHFAK